MHTGNLCYSKYDYEVTNTPLIKIKLLLTIDTFVRLTSQVRSLLRPSTLSFDTLPTSSVNT
jgi:hypothetical protein